MRFNNKKGFVEKKKKKDMDPTVDCVSFPSLSRGHPKLAPWCKSAQQGQNRGNLLWGIPMFCLRLRQSSAMHWRDKNRSIKNLTLKSKIENLKRKTKGKSMNHTRRTCNILGNMMRWEQQQAGRSIQIAQNWLFNLHYTDVRLLKMYNTTRHSEIRKRGTSANPRNSI